jgi:arsenate reductase (thioredoxin)
VSVSFLARTTNDRALGVADPAAIEGSDEEKRKAFVETYMILRRRIELFACLPFDKLDRLALNKRLAEIGRQ